VAESSRLAPPGCRSASNRCRRLRMGVRSVTRSSRRSDSSRKIAVWFSRATGRSRRWWIAAAATEQASARSVLRALLVPAAEPGPPAWPAHPGPARRRRPAAGRWAGPGRWRPRPPSIVRARRPPRPAVAGRLGPWSARQLAWAACCWSRARQRSGSAVGIDPDGDHGRPFVAAGAGPRRAA
jgi:hypothetical protein